MEVNGNTRNNDTSNRLRELLKVEQDDDDDCIGNGNGNGRNYVPRQTLGSVINVNKRSLTSVQSNRTLLDIIREDSSTKEKKTWKHLKEKLRRKKPGSGAAWTSSVHIPASDVIPMQPNVNSASMNNRMMMRRHSTRIPDGDPELTHNLSRRSSMLQRTDSTVPHDPIVVEHNADEQRRRSEEEGMGETEDGNNNGEEGVAPVRMSLMDLLSETDSNYMNADEDDDEDDEEEEEEEEESSERNVESGGEYNNCCVCMVRHKGAAFIPCGHTFCRLCSRELYVQRNYCPICNGYILEILDIF